MMSFRLFALSFAAPRTLEQYRAVEFALSLCSMGGAGQLVVSVGGPGAMFLSMCTRHGATGCLQAGLTLDKAQPAATAPLCRGPQGPLFATCLGLVYLYARHKYFWGYAEAADRRMTGFMLSMGTLILLVVLAALGIASRFLDEYLDLHVAKKLRHPF
ncbi:hypothetical protein A6R68_20790 [Neotoma lepida]|uniref:Microsomal glutathione S-transferase 2 n=1 Tax=Neotoma lepida TaxID=56216 RepID=A0A1A6HTG0_NEOLE|nr:hypothetical protein A6R68_20790 [Neotoma lepida]